MNGNGFGRKEPEPNRGIRKAINPSAKRAGFPVNIRVEHLLNTNVEFYGNNRENTRRCKALDMPVLLYNTTLDFINEHNIFKRFAGFSNLSF
jgi:hypothetical protein